MQLLQFILGLAALIFLHEFGHFLAARLLKVEVEEFGIGFPPRLLGVGLDKDGNRRWFGVKPPADIDPQSMILSLNWIPLGGFVRPKGENDPSIPGGLAAANPWVRLGVLFAGPLMNLLVGVVLATALFYHYGEPIPDKVLVREVAPGSPAEKAGLQPDDLFLTIDGQTIDSVTVLQNLTAQHLDQPVEIKVQRGDQVITVSLVPRSQPPNGEGPMGVMLDNPVRPISLAKSAEYGVQASYENVRGLLLLPVRVLQGAAAPQEGRLVGYKGMYDIYQKVNNPLWFFMAISLSLGVMNLLPIPALDGGRIALTLPEILIRRRVPADYENAIHMIGFVVLLLLLVYINMQDFLNPIHLP